MEIFQCVPNFSEGRNTNVLQAIDEAMTGIAGVALIDFSADWDHHRSVFTLLGNAKGVVAAMKAGARAAVERIDLRQHTGVHPCAGAVDVVPIVPLQGAAMERAMGIAEELGAYFADELRVPVRFYERNTRSRRSPKLPVIRNAAIGTPQCQELQGEATPDRGLQFAHETAGIVIVGARSPLVAYNVNLASSDVRIAQAIARKIRLERETNPIFEGVRALGLVLETQQCAQVSLNITEPDKTPLPPIFRWIRAEANALGTDAVESEIIGAIPRFSLGNETPEAILWRRFRSGQVLENSIVALSLLTSQE